MRFCVPYGERVPMGGQITAALGERDSPQNLCWGGRGPCFYNSSVRQVHATEFLLFPGAPNPLIHRRKEIQTRDLTQGRGQLLPARGSG